MQHDFFNIIILILIALRCIQGDNVSDVLPFLPENESELQVAFLNGIIDSNLYTKIAPFYMQPISVPEGELVILKEIFPEITESVPTGPQDMKKYMPWDNLDIRSFFNDYPELIPLKPILSFSSIPGKIGSLGICSKGYLNSQSYSHYGHISLSPLTILQCKLRMGVSGNQFTISNRLLSARVCPGIQVHAGTFSLNNDNGLFFGYFPLDSFAQSSSFFEKLLISNARSWNGICGSISKYCRTSNTNLSGDIWFHKRYQEMISGANFCIDKQIFVLSAIVSNLKIFQSKENLNYCGIRAAAVIKNFSIQIQSGIDCHKPVIPLLIESSLKYANNDFAVALVLLPQNYYAPRSRLTLLSGMQNTGSLSIVTIKTSHNFTKWIDCHSMVKLMCINDLVQDVICTISCNGSYGWFDYSFQMLQQRYFNGQNENIYSIQSSVICHLKKRHELKASVKIKGSQGLSYLCQDYIGMKIKVFESLHIESYLNASTSNGNKTIIVCGIREVLNLFDKTSSQFLLEIPVVQVRKERSIRVEATMSFLL